MFTYSDILYMSLPVCVRECVRVREQERERERERETERERDCVCVQTTATLRSIRLESAEDSMIEE